MLHFYSIFAFNIRESEILIMSKDEMTEQPWQDDIICFELMLGLNPPTYMACKEPCCMQTCQGTCRAVGFGQFVLVSPVSFLARIFFFYFSFSQPYK